ncbi:MAG: DUF1512 domain-containing protein [Nitrososphaerales archaeon]
MSSNVSSLVPSINLSSLVTFITYGFFFVFMMYGQRIQYYVAETSVTRSLKRLVVMKDSAVRQTTDYFLGITKNSQGVSERLTQFLEYVTIPPVSMDPAGLVNKLEHITKTGEERVRSEVQALLGSDDPVRISVASNLVEISSTLNIIHKVVRHYYLSSKKTNSFIAIFQLQMVLPQIMEMAGALSKATETFKLAQPIGDGVGPLLASKLINGAPTQRIAKDTVMAKTEYNGRTVYVMKAEGPMGWVGEPHVGLERLVEEMAVPLDLIVMVDAAQKFEGEQSGEIAQGVGAAIGGLGIEKFDIEEISAKHHIPVYAVLIKQGDVETLTAMKKELADAVDKAVVMVRRLIDDSTKEGDKVLILGIGNTLGIGQ